MSTQEAPLSTLDQRLDEFDSHLAALVDRLRSDLRLDACELLGEFRALRRSLTPDDVALTDTPRAAVRVAPFYSRPRLIGSNNKVQLARKNPVSGERICGKCNVTKPFADFNVKQPRTGQLHSWCKDCQRAYNRDRYVTVRQVAVDIELLSGDGCIGHLCHRCDRPFLPGQRVTADHLAHSGCAQSRQKAAT